MKRIIVWTLVLTFSGIFQLVNAQTDSTEIVRFEIDGKEVKKNYKVFFRSDGEWIPSSKTPTGFIIPPKLRNDQSLTVLFTLGKYKLEFSEIHSSKFNERWIVGIDNKPFSNENAYLVEGPAVKRVYYINFVGSALETRLFYQEK